MEGTAAGELIIDVPGGDGPDAVADVAPPAEAPDQDALAQQIATVRQQAADSTAEQLKDEDLRPVESLRPLKLRVK